MPRKHKRASIDMPNPTDEPEIPDDFFDDLADEQFVDEVVADVDDEDDEQYTRCMKEIELLSKDIEKRKQKIRESEAGLSVEAKLNQLRRRSSRSRSGSPRSAQRTRKHREEKRKRTRSPNSKSRSPHGSRMRHDDRVRDRRHREMSPFRGRPSRHSRSKSPHHRTKRSSSTHKNLSFLEELAQKFAEKGQAFPEKDALLMGQNQMNLNIDQNVQMQMNPLPHIQPQFNQQIVQPPMNMMPNFQQPMGFPPQQQSNMFYGLNPMNTLAGNAAPPPANPPNLAPFPSVSAVNNHIQPKIPGIGPNIHMFHQTATEKAFSNNQKALIDRCEHAIKLIRAKDNKVPVMKFLFNRTSYVVSNSNELPPNLTKKSPLQSHSTMNPAFKLNAAPNASVKNIAGLKMLPKRVREIAQSLSIDSTFLFEKTRTKELTAQITDQIRSGLTEQDTIPQGEVLVQTNTIPLATVETSDYGTQTAEFNCDECTERSQRVMINKHTQSTWKSCNIGVQTNEKDYREPIVELLSKMTAAQLVALKDFANIVDEPRPQNSVDMFKIRERLMDIYNLSQRDADAVRSAEENRLDDIQYIEQIRFRSGDLYTEGSSRDFERRSGSPRIFNGNNRMETITFNNDRSRMDDRNIPPARSLDERFQRMDDDLFQPPLHPEDEEELERQRYIEMERQRELELELTQRRYDEQMERDRERERRRLECLEQDRRQLAMQSNMSFPGPSNHSMQLDDDMRNFSRDPDDRDMQRQNNFNMGRGGTMNRRGRGAFRDNFRGRGRRN